MDQVQSGGSVSIISALNFEDLIRKKKHIKYFVNNFYIDDMLK